MSQLFQLNVIKTGVEHWRANRADNRCMGTIFWQFNDNWPVVSWASVDYNGRWKALHFSAKNFYSHILITAAESDGELRISLINDFARDVSGNVSIMLRKYSGEIVFEKTFDATIEKCHSKIIFSQNSTDFLNNSDRNNCYLIVEFSNKNSSSKNIYHFSVLKNATLVNPKLKLVPLNNDEIKISAKNFAKCVFLDCENPNAQFSDNYFDLLPDETKIVKLIPVKNEIPINENDYQSVSAISLYDLK